MDEHVLPLDSPDATLAADIRRLFDQAIMPTDIADAIHRECSALGAGEEPP